MEMSIEEVRKNLDYLEHHGIKGQRWGIRRTPEQLGHILKKKNARHYGKYNSAVKKISKIQGTKTINELSPKEKDKITKAVNKAENYLKKMESTEEKYGEKIQKAEEKAATKAENERIRIESKKEKLIKKQDWQGIIDNKKLFTEKELNDAANKINAEKRMKEALESNAMDKAAKKIKSAANLVGSGLDLYNNIKSIQDIYSAGKKEKAYKEIRQLMADGNNAEIIKKSINIGDKDIENFDKRRKFLNELRKGTSTTSSSYSSQKSPDILTGEVFGEGSSSKNRRHGGIRGQNGDAKDNIIDGTYSEVFDNYLPLVLNDVGDFKLSDLKK